MLQFASDTEHKIYLNSILSNCRWLPELKQGKSLVAIDSKKPDFCPNYFDVHEETDTMVWHHAATCDAQISWIAFTTEVEPLVHSYSNKYICQ